MVSEPSDPHRDLPGLKTGSIKMFREGNAPCRQICPFSGSVPELKGDEVTSECSGDRKKEYRSWLEKECTEFPGLLS